MSEFLDISRGIVEDFLQTAVFLDDLADFPVNEIVPTNIMDPTSGEANQAVLPVLGSTGLSNNNLDAKKVTDTFMKKGIVCSVVKCDEATFATEKSNYLKLMKKADIIVLDWDLFGDGGEKIVGIINDLIQTDESLHELRSIVVYTATDLGTVQSRLERESLTFESYMSHNKKYTTVSLWNKDSVSALPTRKADFSQVVDRCINEFTETFHGIVPNVAMAAISEVRKNTHKLLGVLNKELDPAYLSHRALLSLPEEAEKHLEEIIISEIESIIHGNEVGKKSNYEVLEKSILVSEKRYESVLFKEYLQDGIDQKLNDAQKGKLKKDVKKCFTAKWYGLEGESQKSEKNFAILSLLQTNYSYKPNSLTLGVILEIKDAKKNKLVCLQPRCDSIRLTGNTDFIFLELKESSDKFDLLFDEDDKKYKIVYGKEYRKTIAFPASVNKIIESSENVFKDTAGIEYKLVGSLKKSQAQRVANEFGAYISRVGLNESEYLRRNRL